MKPAKVIAMVAVALALAATAAAHHAASPVYDLTRTIEVHGVVREFRLVNPHSLMTIEVDNDAGSTVLWTVEFDGRTNLTAYGWKPDSVAVGERVRVTGNPTHTGSPRVFFQRLSREDGRIVERPINVFFGEGIPEEIRRRREERATNDADQGVELAPGEE
jgi:hypothetical protein